MKLYSNVIGEGKAFLILHGFLGMGDNWKTLGKQFADDGFEVHLIDQRNHGKSPHSEDFSYELMAEDLAEYCNSHNLKDVILLGHSMGGKTAMLFSCLHPEFVEKLVVVDIAPKYYAPHHQQILKGLTALDEANITSRGDAEDFLKKYIPETGVRLFLLKNLYWKTKEKLSLRLNLSALIDNIDEVGLALNPDQKFEKSTVFIRGLNSDYIQKSDFGLIEEHFPASEIIEITGAGHWVHAEKMKEFYTAVSNFV